MPEVRYVSPEGFVVRGYMWWSCRTIPGHFEGCTPERAEEAFADMRTNQSAPNPTPATGDT